MILVLRLTSTEATRPTIIASLSDARAPILTRSSIVMSIPPQYASAILTRFVIIDDAWGVLLASWRSSSAAGAPSSPQARTALKPRESNASEWAKRAAFPSIPYAPTLGLGKRG